MTNWQWLGFASSLIYVSIWLGVSCGLTIGDKHNDRPVLVTLVLGLVWPLLVAVLAGIACHEMITGEKYADTTPTTR